MATISNMYDILNREPYTFHIHKEACQRKIDKIVVNVGGDKRRLNNAEKELVSSVECVIDTKIKRDHLKRHLQFGSYANLMHRLITFDDDECCITCGSTQGLTRSHIGASRPELISRAVDSFAKQGRATLGEVTMKFLQLHGDDPIAPQCPECHRTFAHMQKEWREINAQKDKETATKRRLVVFSRG